MTVVRVIDTISRVVLADLANITMVNLRPVTHPQSLMILESQKNVWSLNNLLCVRNLFRWADARWSVASFALKLAVHVVIVMMSLSMFTHCAYMYMYVMCNVRLIGLGCS